jgi:hypothetical protein
VEKSNKTLVRVSFNQFMHNGAKHTLAGTVQNKGTAPGTYTLKFEFLDKTGSVVATQSATVGPVEPNQSKDFTVSVTQTGIVAYRYAPIM